MRFSVEVKASGSHRWHVVRAFGERLTFGTQEEAQRALDDLLKWIGETGDTFRVSRRR